jgi:hypothetical protein
VVRKFTYNGARPSTPGPFLFAPAILGSSRDTVLDEPLPDKLAMLSKRLTEESSEPAIEGQQNIRGTED